MVAPDGATIDPPYEAELTPPTPNNPELKAALPIVLQILGSTFAVAGRYTLHIRVNGEELKQVGITVQPLGQPATVTP
jgi:hypothetical protein